MNGAVIALAILNILLGLINIAVLHDVADAKEAISMLIKITEGLNELGKKDRSNYAKLEDVHSQRLMNLERKTAENERKINSMRMTTIYEGEKGNE